MSLQKEFSDAIEVVKRNASVMEDVAKRENSTRVGFIILFISVIANTLGLFLSKNSNLDFSNPRFIIFSLVSGILMPVAGIMIMHYIATLKGGLGKFEEFLRVILRGYILGWLGIIPLSFISLIMLWQIWIMHRSIMVVYKLNSRSAVSVILWTIAVFIGLGYIIASLGVHFGFLSLSKPV